MTVEVLHAWVQGDYVGYFERRRPEEIATFVYDDDANHDVSLSFRRGAASNRKAAQNYLDGLIPEEPGAIENLRTATKAQSASSWDLLQATQGDLSGGILLLSNRDEFDRGISHTRVATPAAIGAKIVRVVQGSSGYESTDGTPRFMLAGVQAKFAIHRTTDGVDFWPDAATPSTHILKPAAKAHIGLNELEAAALNLARIIGLRAAMGRVEEFEGNSSFVVERFDRQINAAGQVVRIHTEDVLQALSRSPAHKYEVMARDIIELLRKFDSEADAEYEFIEQLAFNVAIGNADAHGKNYTLIHEDSRVRLSPLYDTVPVALYPEYDQALSMKIGRQAKPFGVRPSDWVGLSKTAGLDADRVLASVGHVERSFLEHSEQVLGVTETAQLRRAEFEKLLRRAERSVELNPVQV